MWPPLVFPPINLYSYPRTEEITPCTKLCKLIGGECSGCGRTLAEIRDWKTYTTAEKIKIIERLYDDKQTAF